MGERNENKSTEQQQLGEITEENSRRGFGKRYFGRGGVKFALLKLLAHEPMHGYQMMKALEEQSGGHYVPSAGSIYPTLQMLEERSFVSIQEEEGGKKVYSITEQGLAVLTLLPDKSRHHGAWHDRHSPEAKSFRNEKIRQKLGLSNDSFDLLLLIKRAEQAASSSKERANQLQLLLIEQQNQLNKFLAAAEHTDEGELN